MNTIESLYRDLSYGEFSNLALSNDGGGTIQEAAQPKIILAANEGLLRLYSKFVLKERDLLIRMVSGVIHYHLLSRFATSHEPKVEQHTYIQDMIHEPFEDDVIRIMAVYNSAGIELPLNDLESPMSVFSPQANVLQVPQPTHGVPLSILYQARHVKLDPTKPEQPIELPDVLWGALTAFIAYKVFSQMNTAESTAKAQEHYSNYELLCQDVIDRDLVCTSGVTTNTRFDKRGWA